MSFSNHFVLYYNIYSIISVFIDYLLTKMYHHITMMLCWIAIPFSYFICAYVWICLNVVRRARVHAYCVYTCGYACAQIMKVPVAASITVCVLIPNRSCITARVLPPVKREDNII